MLFITTCTLAVPSASWLDANTVSVRPSFHQLELQIFRRLRGGPFTFKPVDARLVGYR